MLNVDVVVGAEVVVSSSWQRRAVVLHVAGVYAVQFPSTVHGSPTLYIASPVFRGLNEDYFAALRAKEYYSVSLPFFC